MTSMTHEQAEQYRTEGWCLLERAIPDAHLQALRAECGRYIAEKDAEMDRLGVDTLGISHRGSRYFVSNCHLTSAAISDFLFSPLMAAVCTGAFGHPGYLFYDQYVVKGAEGGMPFAWHQDSGYVNANGGDPEHPPYLTCWCPLDDVSVANGTVRLLPYSRLGIRTAVRHVKDPGTNDWVGYFGDDPGIAIECPAGSILAFSSVAFHCSGANTTDRMRRVFLAQYSSQPLLRSGTTRPWAHAVPFPQAYSTIRSD